MAVYYNTSKTTDPGNVINGEISTAMIDVDDRFATKESLENKFSIATQLIEAKSKESKETSKEIIDLISNIEDDIEDIKCDIIDNVSDMDCLEEKIKDIKEIATKIEVSMNEKFFYLKDDLKENNKEFKEDVDRKLNTYSTTAIVSIIISIFSMLSTVLFLALN